MGAVGLGHVPEGVTEITGAVVQDLPVSGEKVYRALREREALPRRSS